LTPLEVAETLLPLIRRDTTPPGKHSTAFLESYVDAVLAAAQASTERYKNGKPLGPLDGVPIAVKDEVLVKGYKRTLASKLDFKKGIDETSWCVRKWEEAGAIVVGKTNMHECGCGELLSFLKT
jgi:Asp-tRNA(Asn)/Glu-tRNA(Gln) amidotransferase A subunit family amidase